MPSLTCGCNPEHLKRLRLTLPPSLLLLLCPVQNRAWALNATTWCHMDLSKHYLCYVSSSVDPTSLPPITFRLSQVRQSGSVSSSTCESVTMIYR